MPPKPPYLGAAYYPEAWPEATIEEDIARAREIGVNCLRIGEFAWSRMERTEGSHDFDWLHRVVDRLGAADIAVVLGTPTATPPAWLTRKYPETVIVTAAGRRLSHGGRRHGCPNSPKYRELSAGIVRKMAEEFAHDPAIIGWQIDNEFGCHQNGCFCPACRAQWLKWLERRYGTLDRLNECWGTELWSQWYTEWEEIPVPEEAGADHHPSVLYHWRMFMSDSYADYCMDQYRILHEAGAPNVTTDGMPPFHRLDYEVMFRDLDLVANNVYFPPEMYAGIIGECDWMRPRKPRPYWFTESAAGWTGGGAVGSLYLPRPGSIRARGWLMTALGGEMVLYWLYRGHWSGQEMLAGSLLYHFGEPTIGCGEIRALAEELAHAGEFLGETRVPQAEVAIHYHTPSSWLLDHEPHVPDVHYDRCWTEGFHAPLVAANIHRDVLFSGDDLAGYRVLLSPYMAWIPDDVLERALEAVRNGMTWVVGPLASVRSEHATLFPDCALGPIERSLPFRVVGRFPATGMDPPVVWTDRCSRGNATQWCEVFEPESTAAKPLAIYEGGPAAGGIGALEVSHGKGKVVLLGFTPDPADPGWLLHLLARSGVTPTCAATEGIAVVPRVGPSHRGWIVFDWKGLGGSAALPEPGLDILSGGDCANGVVVVEPYGVAVVRAV